MVANKNAFVTGGSRGIGKEIALQLARTGANVAINYVSNAAAAEAVVTEIESFGVKAIALQGDVSEASAVTEMIETVVSTFGSIDILVNN
ncbi:MAG: SDR family NAD(P)-dependent oxidoreductase, partial [Bacilli bacterium]